MDVIIKRRPVNIPVLPLAAGALVVLLLLTTMRMDRIAADQIGVFVNNVSGEIQVVVDPGVQIYNGWITDFYVLDNTEQSYRMADDGQQNDSVKIKTKDGADVSLNVVINYRLVSDPEVIRNAIVPECGLHRVEQLATNAPARSRVASAVTELVDAYKTKWIRDYARAVVRFKFGELTPKSFYVAEDRNAKARESMDALNTLLNPRGIDVRLVGPETYKFYDEFETMINDKQSAEQEVKSEESKARAALQAQERERTKATAIKNVAVARIMGVLDKAVLEVEAEAERDLKGAEAYAYTTKTLADADFYKASNEAKAIVARASAEAEGMRQLVQSMAGAGASNLVKLEYARALNEAQITGVPYATDPRIQKVELSGVNR